MKIGKLILAKTLILAALFASAARSNAACGDPSADLVNALNNAYGVLQSEQHERTNNPAATPLEKKQAAAIARALNTLALPATNTFQLYSLFLKGAQQLGALALTDPQIAVAGSNVFTAFTNQSQAEIECATARVAALGEFNRSKKPASNQVAQAAQTLIAIGSQSNPQIGLLLARQVFQKIFVANKLAAIGEAHPGFAPNGVVGETLTHTERGETGTVHFDNDTQATEVPANDPPRTSSYSYDRTGLNNADLKLEYPGDVSGTNTTLVKLRFQSNTNGTFTYKFTDADGSRGSGSGRFSITD